MMNLFRKKPVIDADFVPPLGFTPKVSEHLEQVYANASAIVEYGSGGSTALAARLGKTIVSVESDAGWAANMRAHLERTYPGAPVRVEHADIGPTKKWGQPRFPWRNKTFHRYPLAVWEKLTPAEEPDVVLVDGRFRVACFLTSVLCARKQMRVLFDDYRMRPEYHIVEAVISPVRLIDNMAEFSVEPGMDMRPVLTVLGSSLIWPR